MAIDTGLGAIYNENFPVRGVDQSSQGFRDNFTIIKRAIENLQNVTSTPQSFLKLELTAGAGGELFSNISYPNNAFFLPTGNPSVDPASGMIRYHNGTMQVHDGQGWRNLLMTDNQGGVTIPSTSHLKLPTGSSAERPFVPTDGMMRVNSTFGAVEFFYGGEWKRVGEGAGGGSSSGSFVDASVSGFLTLQNLPVNPTDAVNLLALNNFGANLVAGPHENGISVLYNTGTRRATFSPRPFDIELAGDVLGVATVTNLGSVVLDTVLAEGVGLSLKDVRDEIGTTIKGAIRLPGQSEDSETGINVFYDAANNTISLAPRDFRISLTGDVVGNAVVHYLGDTTINATIPQIFRGLTVFDEGTIVAPAGALSTVRAMNFVGNGITATQTGGTATITVNSVTSQNIRDVIGTTVKGTIRDPETLEESETGINVYYDSVNNTVSLAPRTFKITLEGDVTGNAVVERLGNTTITTTTTAIKGITAYDEGVMLGLPNSLKAINFTGGGVEASRSGENLNIYIPSTLSANDVRNEVGGFVRGVSRDPLSQIETETGITVNFDPENNVLELGVREFDIILTGAVRGTARVKRLDNVSIATTSDFIDGLTINQGGVLQGRSIKELNIVGGSATVANGVATINVTSGTDQTQVRDLVRQMMVGTRRGTNVTYDTSNQVIRVGVNPIEITLAGAVTGTGIIQFNGGANESRVTIQTETIADRGVEVRDEGGVQGTSVTAINFVGGGVTSAVSVDGEIATVYIPNSPANEQFILIDNGSANVPNARRLTAGVGITLNDGGPGGSLTISAQSDELLANTQFLLNGELITESPTLEIRSTDQIYASVVEEDDKAVICFYSLEDGWWRQDENDFGEITDKYGISLDMGGLGGGILEANINLGTIT